MTNAEILSFTSAADDLGDLTGNNKFRFALIKNKRRLKSEAQDYQKALNGLIDKHGMTDENGDFIENPDNPVGVEVHDREAFTRDLDELLQEEVDVDIHTVDAEHVPDQITLNQLESLEVMIDGL
jgi:hypothetical protein